MTSEEVKEALNKEILELSREFPFLKDGYADISEYYMVQLARGVCLRLGIIGGFELENYGGAVKGQLGDIMKNQRKKMKLTQEEMAERIGVDRTTIIKWEQTAKNKIQPILEAYGLGVVAKGQ